MSSSMGMAYPQLRRRSKAQRQHSPERGAELGAEIRLHEQSEEK
jgi:hypothetical protein